MTLRRVESGQARLLALAVEFDFPKRTTDWLDHLSKGELTEEMQNVFEAFGYLEKRTRRQSKPRVATSPDPLVSETELDRAVADAAGQTSTYEDGPVRRPAEDVVRFAHGDEPASDYERPVLDLPT